MICRLMFDDAKCEEEEDRCVTDVCRCSKLEGGGGGGGYNTQVKSTDLLLEVSTRTSVFDVRPPIRFTTSWTAWCVESTHHEYWRELGGSSQKKMNEPSDDSEVVTNSLEVPDSQEARRSTQQKRCYCFGKTQDIKC